MVQVERLWISIDNASSYTVWSLGVVLEKVKDKANPHGAVFPSLTHQIHISQNRREVGNMK